MIDKSSLLKSQGSLYLEFIPIDGLFHKMLLLSLMEFLTGWCNLKLLCDFVRISHFLPRNDTNSILEEIGFLVVPPAPLFTWIWRRIGIALMQNELYKNYGTDKQKSTVIFIHFAFLNRTWQFSKRTQLHNIDFMTCSKAEI